MLFSGASEQFLPYFNINKFVHCREMDVFSIFENNQRIKFLHMFLNIPNCNYSLHLYAIGGPFM